MPFREVCVEELREQMVLEALAGRRDEGGDSEEQFSGHPQDEYISGWSAIRRMGEKRLTDLSRITAPLGARDR